LPNRVSREKLWCDEMEMEMGNLHLERVTRDGDYLELSVQMERGVEAQTSGGKKGRHEAGTSKKAKKEGSVDSV
jgi:hypothetical protein